MNNILAQILGIRTAAITRGQIAYGRVIAPAIIIFILLFIVGLGVNLAGLKGLNLFLSLLADMIILACALRAEIIVNIIFTGIVSGIVQTPQTMPEEIKKFFTWYVGLVGYTLLWVSIVFFFLGTLDARGHIQLIIGMIAAIVLLQLISAFWDVGKSWGKKIIFWYAIIMLGVFVVSFLFDSAGLASSSWKITKFINTKWAKVAQSTNTRQIPRGTTIYSCANGTIKPSTLRYGRAVSIISLNETMEKNGAVYEKVGLPDPTTGQPGSLIGYIFSGDGSSSQISSSGNAASGMEEYADAFQKLQAGESVEIFISSGGWAGLNIPAGKFSLRPATTRAKINGEYRETGGIYTQKNSGEAKFALPGISSGNLIIKKIS